MKQSFVVAVDVVGGDRTGGFGSVVAWTLWITISMLRLMLWWFVVVLGGFCFLVSFSWGIVMFSANRRNLSCRAIG